MDILIECFACIKNIYLISVRKLSYCFIARREFVAFPKPDRNGNQIIFHRLADTRSSQYIFNDGIKLLLMSVDMNLNLNGCAPGYIFFFDMQGASLGHLTRLSINSIRKFFEYLQEGMPVRLKAIHIVNVVWFMDKVLALLRPFMKREFYEMVNCSLISCSLAGAASRFQ